MVSYLEKKTNNETTFKNLNAQNVTISDEKVENLERISQKEKENSCGF